VSGASEEGRAGGGVKYLKEWPGLSKSGRVYPGCVFALPGATGVSFSRSGRTLPQRAAGFTPAELKAAGVNPAALARNVSPLPTAERLGAATMQTTPFAIHITWSCYGTFLPGDERGHVSSVLTPGEGYLAPSRGYGTPVAVGDPEVRAKAASLQKYETVRLTVSQAVCVATSLVEAVAPRGWWILRAAVMANHTHVLVGGCPQDGPAVRRILIRGEPSRSEPTERFTAAVVDRKRQ
jgi:hypothetical protein